MLIDIFLGCTLDYTIFSLSFQEKQNKFMFLFSPKKEVTRHTLVTQLETETFYFFPETI